MRDLLIDSSVLIEYFKGSEQAVRLMEHFESSNDAIEKYALLPNDALILVTCIERGFSLATMDEDFKVPAEKERLKS